MGSAFNKGFYSSLFHYFFVGGGGVKCELS